MQTERTQLIVERDGIDRKANSTPSLLYLFYPHPLSL